MRSRVATVVAAVLIGVAAVAVSSHLAARPEASPRSVEPFVVPAGDLPDPPEMAVQTVPEPQHDRLAVPSLGVTAPLEQAAVRDGRLTLPDDIARAVVWDGSAPLGARRGAVLVAGHRDDSSGRSGVLHDLGDVVAGAEVDVVLDGTVTAWKVVALTAVLKTELPAELWAGPHGPRRLYLVTCGGPLVDGHYRDNVVVTAVPVRPDRGP